MYLDGFKISNPHPKITLPELSVGSILYLERDLTDKFNVYKIDLKYENSIVGSLPINYSKALAIEIDLNNANFIAEVKYIQKDRMCIFFKKIN